MLTINPCSLLKDELSGLLDTPTASIIINTDSDLTIVHVTLCSHLRNINLLDETSRTWTLPKEFDVRKKNSGKRCILDGVATQIVIVLLWIISRIAEKSWEDSSCNSVSTTNDNSIFIRMHELLVKKKFPYSMHQFTLAMSLDI